MTGCHYKKCLRAASFIEPSQVAPTAGFGEAASPAQPHQAGTGTARGAHGTRLGSAEQEAKQNISICILLTHTHKTNSAVTQRRGQLFFPLMAKTVLEPW